MFAARDCLKIDLLMPAILPQQHGNHIPGVVTPSVF